MNNKYFCIEIEIFMPVTVVTADRGFISRSAQSLDKLFMETQVHIIMTLEIVLTPKTLN